LEELEFEKEYNNEALEALWKKVSEAESEPAIVNLPRVLQVEFAYAVMKYLAKDIPGSKLSYQLNEPFKNMGTVTLEAKQLVFTKREWFARAAEFASNMEIYPLADGRVRLTLTFWGVAKPLEGGKAE